MAQSGSGNPDQHLTMTWIIELHLFDGQRLRFRIRRRKAHLVENGGFNFHVAAALAVLPGARRPGSMARTGAAPPEGLGLLWSRTTEIATPHRPSRVEARRTPSDWR